MCARRAAHLHDPRMNRLASSEVCDPVLHGALASVSPGSRAAISIDEYARAPGQEDQCHTRVIGTFPTRDSFMRMVATLLAEQDDEWRA
jgi:hypothetical protein